MPIPITFLSHVLSIPQTFLLLVMSVPCTFLSLVMSALCTFLSLVMFIPVLIPLFSFSTVRHTVNEIRLQLGSLSVQMLMHIQILGWTGLVGTG